jgi:hypothetical protein
MHTDGCMYVQYCMYVCTYIHTYILLLHYLTSNGATRLSPCRAKMHAGEPTDSFGFSFPSDREERLLGSQLPSRGHDLLPAPCRTPPEEPYKLTLQCYVTRWLCSNMTSSIAPSMQFSPTKQSHWLTDPFEVGCNPPLRG